MHYATEHPKMQNYDIRLAAMTAVTFMERNDPFINPDRLNKLCDLLGVARQDADAVAQSLATRMVDADHSEGKNASDNQDTRNGEILIDMLLAI